MTTPRRNWQFYIQICGLACFWIFSISVNGWFIWRAIALKDLGDAWLPAASIGALVGPLFILFSVIISLIFYTISFQNNPKEPVPASNPLPSENILVEPILNRPPTGFFITVGILLLFSLWAGFAWMFQLHQGLTVTGLNSPVFWGFYITNFVFFIGISHAGTLISAILRISNAEWRRPITRSAEVITVLVLCFGAGNILLDLGRPERALNVFFFGRHQSPLLWDVCSITTYLIGSSLYLYLPLIPDIAIIRDRITDWRKPLYELLSLGWKGTPKERKVLEKCIAIMAVVVIPVAISVHTVVSFVFSMTIQPMWHSAIFGPYFVVGAIFSGIAALILAMAILRAAYHLEDYLRPIIFENLGILLLVMSCLWFYFTFSEYLTTWYGNEPEHLAVFYSKFTGKYAVPFWIMMATCFFIPFGALVFAGKKVWGTVAASGSVCVGMWLERFLIVVPTLVRPRLPYAEGSYWPSWVEISLFAGCLSTFGLLYALFTRFFPIVSIWELRDGRENALKEVSERIKRYFPI